MRDETILMLAGGALLVGVILHRKFTAPADQLDEGTGGQWPWGPGGWVDDTPPIGGPVSPPSSATPVSPTPPIGAPPAPSMTAAQQNTAFAAQEAQAHAQQQADYDQQVAELRARVASGAVTVGSPYYVSTLAYLANLRGGVATAEAELAKLHQAGLAGARGRARGPRLAWDRDLA